MKEIIGGLMALSLAAGVGAVSSRGRVTPLPASRVERVAEENQVLAARVLQRAARVDRLMRARASARKASSTR